MRIYDTDTLYSFIEALSNCKRAIVCCRTIRIGNNPKEITPYGVFIELWGNHGDLYAQWNEYDTDSESQTIEIPCILGAAYATYKDYWLYLCRLKGIMSYGSDEAYISLKVWLSGGKCLLLKHIVVGHLYRKDPPYRIKHVDYVYNKVFISLLLLLLPVNSGLNILNYFCGTFRIEGCEKCWIKYLCVEGCFSEKILTRRYNKTLSHDECLLRKTYWHFIISLYIINKTKKRHYECINVCFF